MKKNVLVFPCGSEIGLEINNALKFSKDIVIYGGSSVLDHGRFVYKNFINNIPNVDDEDFIEKLSEIINEYNIDFIIPAHDSVVLKLAQNRDKLDTEIITSDKETCEVCRSKKLTYQILKNEYFTPAVYEKIEDVYEFPVFLKPDVGQGSKGVALATNLQELEYHIEKNKDLLILEYLPGEEYTIDCFTDKHGNIRFTGMRERRRIKSGISVNSATMVCNGEVLKIAEKINQTLNLRGAWFFQVKKDINNEYKLLEVAPRIAGTMSVYRNKGINFPLLSIYDRLGYDLDILENNFNIEIDRALINRFVTDIDYERIYIDFDDTITLNNTINPYIMMFVYQSLMKEKEIILITKHNKEITKTLKSLKIDINIFDEIIHITKDDEKYKYINTDKSSIFIDDSYSERLRIKEKLNIPVFDIDSVECLIDWRN